MILEMKFAILAIITVGIQHSVSQGIIAGVYDCPAPWLPFEEKCYKFELYEDSLDNANTACDSDGASLVSVNTRDEHEFIASWLSSNALQNRKWYTSGVRQRNDDNRFDWEGDGTRVEGTQYWLDEQARKEPGDQILYGTRGQSWGWIMGRHTEANVVIRRPYICEIHKADVFRILSEEKGYDYGVLETDLSKIHRGPQFIEQPRDVLFDDSSEHEQLSLECVAEGNPDVAYSWYKRREQVYQQVNLTLSKYTLTNGRLTINDPDDSRNDNGEYQCRANNVIGTILSNSAVVSFGYLNDFPKSARDPVMVSAFQGTGIECNPPTHGYPRLNYQWFKDGNFIYTQRKPYIFVSLNGKLYFSSATRDDEGEYQCIITVPATRYSHNGGKTSQPIKLIVRESLGSESPPQIESGFPAVFPSSPKVGDNVTIECFARGYSSQIDGMQYSWQRVGGVLPDNAILRDFNRVLYIPNIQEINEGEYKCTVRLVQNSGSNSRGVVVPVEADPFFTIPLKNQHVDLGSTLVWRCQAYGDPRVSYKWIKDANVITVADLPQADRDRYEISNNVLTIADVGPSDEGMYQCRASNTRATRYSAGQLRVLSFAPSFVKYPVQERIYATLRGNVTVICQPEAAPDATKTWYKNNQIIAEQTTQFDRVHKLPNGNLYISSLRDSDGGKYKCVASNVYGEAESEGTLTILPTTTITNFPLDTVVQVNKTAFFHCEASFNPALDITYDWYHNDYHIQFIKIRIIGEVPFIEKEDYFERGTGINRGGLYIRNVQYFHKGDYTCVAKTSSDEISRSAKLNVIGPPFPPVGVQVDQVTSESARVMWKMSAPAANGKEVTGYIVEKKHENETYWSRAVGDVMRNSMEATVSGLIPASPYRFRVRAENILGIGDPSMPSDSVYTQDAKPVTHPRNLGRCVNKVGTLCISWDPVPVFERNGAGFGYVVQHKKSYILDEEWTVVNITDPTQSEYVALVGQRNFYTEYDVQIRSRNHLGFGPPSPMVTIFSAMDIPSAQPTQLRIWQHNATALLVEWDPVENTVEQMKGVLMGYRINYWRTCCESEETAIFNQVLGQTDHGMIIGLYPYTEYEVNVQVYNEAGYGPKTDTLLQETLRAAPMEAPQEVKVYVEGPRSIRVMWRGVSTTIREEPLEGYIIRYWRQSENRYMSYDIDTMKKTDYVVKGLDKNIMYELRVLGYSRGGDGLMSSPIVTFVLGKNCYVREDSPDSHYVYKCRGETGGTSAAQISVTTLFIVFIMQRILSHL